MGNLFLVFTPLQLFVAQQIIRQEKLQNCVLLQGYVSGNKHFYEVYDMMLIADLWTARIDFPGDLPGWDGFQLKSYADARKAYNNYQFIKRLLKKYDISDIYVGEILNQACRFTCVLFSRQGYRVSFFEEGTSHYVDRPYKADNSFKKKLKTFAYDILYYLPVYHVRFAKWRLNPNMPSQGLPMYRRYSMIPFHHEKFDVMLHPEPMFSDKLLKFVEANIRPEEGEHRVMLMTDPLRELVPKEYLYLYFDTIEEALKDVDKEQFLYIKFHPREIESSRKRILEIAENSGLRYKVLSEEVNICVEYYLQKFHFEKIYFFNAATYFYNGYAFPKMNFVRLMPVVYEKCKAAGVKNLTYMENMLNMIISLQE